MFYNCDEMCLSFDGQNLAYFLLSDFFINIHLFYLFIYLPAFLDSGLPRGNVHERDSGPMRGAIPTQPHNP